MPEARAKLDRLLSDDIVYIARIPKKTTLFAAGKAMAKTQKEDSAFAPEVDLIFYVRFMLIVGRNVLDDFVERLRASRAGSDSEACTPQETVRQAADVVGSRLRDSYEDYKTRAGCDYQGRDESMEGNKDFKQAVVIAAYTENSLAVWRAYNKAKKAKKSWDDRELKVQVNNAEERRWDYEDALPDPRDFYYRRDSIEKALREPELKGSAMNEINFRCEGSLSRMVELLDQKWKEQVERTWEAPTDT